MTAEEKRIRERYQRHVRRLRWWLKPLPRRARLHHYPILKWFAAMARKRSYLWSLRPSAVIPALYAGFILTYQPLIGVQIILACVLALVLRANLPILVSLQFISTPFTVPFLWPFQYYIGSSVIGLFSVQEEFRDAAIEAVSTSHSLMSGFVKGGNVAMAVMVGGLILGWLCASPCAVLYRFFSGRTEQAFRDFRAHRKARQTAAPQALAQDPEQVPVDPDFRPQ